MPLSWVGEPQSLSFFNRASHFAGPVLKEDDVMVVLDVAERLLRDEEKSLRIGRNGQEFVARILHPDVVQRQVADLPIQDSNSDASYSDLILQLKILFEFVRPLHKREVQASVCLRKLHWHAHQHEDCLIRVRCMYIHFHMHGRVKLNCLWWEHYKTAERSFFGCPMKENVAQSHRLNAASLITSALVGTGWRFSCNIANFKRSSHQSMQMPHLWKLQWCDQNPPYCPSIEPAKFAENVPNVPSAKSSCLKNIR